MSRSLLYIVLLSLSHLAMGQSSVLKTGKWFKVSIDHDGVYKLSGDQFSRMGFSGKIDPTLIKVFTYPTGMLPQSNAAPRPSGLVEIPVLVDDGGDNSFDKNDFILFYALGPNTADFLPEKNVFRLATNLYSDKNYCFITIGETAGKRMASRPPGSGGTTINTYHDYVFHETEQVNILRSGRDWFGEDFELTPEREISFDIPGILTTAPLKVISKVMGQSYMTSSFDVYFNGIAILNQQVPVISDSPYASKGRVRIDTVSVNAGDVGAGATGNQRIRYKFNKASSRKSAAFLDFVSINFERSLNLRQDQVIFRNGAARSGLFRYEIANAPSGLVIWNVTDPLSPTSQEYNLASSIASFSINTGSNAETFVAFKGNVPSPALEGEVLNQDLRGMSVPHLLVITPPDFLAEAERLASHRRSINGLDVAVVLLEEVYNEFSSGRADLTAIRDFSRWLYLKDPDKLKSLLLFGKSSYDYKQRIRNNTNLIPTYESRNSLSPLETFSSDDYFAFLEDSEGEWEESFLENHTMDIGVGRLPVKSLEEARVVVDKLIAYDIDEKKFGRWRKDIVFVADDGSLSDGFTSIHQSQANTMADELEMEVGIFNTRKIFLGSYSKKPSPNGETIPEANIHIREEFENAVIVNYTGHGSEKLWADERVLTPEDIQEVRNSTYPFLVTATCEFGRHDDPQEISSAEQTILRERGGSIGLVTTARPVNSSTNFDLNQAFYAALLERESGQWRSIGEVFRYTKNNSSSGVGNRNFSLLGDPSMVLGVPSGTIVIDKIKTESGSDTLKALSKVVVEGRVLNADGAINTEFEGTLEATLFDKQTQYQTIGKNDPPFTYSQWSNPLFRGKASVKEGSFSFRFPLPKNIAYEVDFAKLSIYAFDIKRGTDATGSSRTFKVGGSEPNPGTDTKSPRMKVFMGDSTFVNGGSVTPNTTLVVRLEDESGINISDYGIGSTMTAVLDNDLASYTINRSFIADVDDYTRGWVHYPLYDLPPGRHSLTVKAWDVFNNPVQATVDFIVTGEDVLVIEEFGNSPNPFREETTIFFTHNRPGDDLSVEVSIVNAAGSNVGDFRLEVPASPYRVDIVQLQASMKKMSPGLYFARLRVRSLTSGAESVQASKLIMVN